MKIRNPAYSVKYATNIFNSLLKNISFVFLLLSTFIVLPSYAENTLTKPITKSAQHKEDIKHYLPEHKVTSLLAGPDSYLMLVNKNTHINTKGVIILIPEWHQGGVHTDELHFLQQSLPLDGWTTISIQPPNKPSKYPSTTINLAEREEENQLIMAKYNEKISVLIKAVIEEAKTFPGAIFILSKGNNAAIIANILNLAMQKNSPNIEKNAYKIDGMILLSSYLHSDESSIDILNTDFAHNIASMELPILDLTLKHDHLLVQGKANERKRLAEQEMKVYYRQRKLNNFVAGIYPEKTLLSQIDSWVVSIGW